MKCACALLTLALLNIHLHCMTHAEVLRIQDYPFIVSLADTRDIGEIGYLYCEGAIVARTLIITAASCFVDVGILQSVVDSGAIRVHSNTDQPYECYMEHLVVKLYVHEKYDPDGFDDDIALVQVKEEFVNKFEKPVKLAGKNFEYRIGSTAQRIGWASSGAHYTGYQSAEVQMVDIGVCQKQYRGKPTNLTSRMICGKITDNYRGGADGDLLYQNGHLIGIQIIDHRDGSKVYTKVSEYDDWIRNKLKQESSTSQSVQLTAKKC